jgi:hypothetical protein
MSSLVQPRPAKVALFVLFSALCILAALAPRSDASASRDGWGLSIAGEETNWPNNTTFPWIESEGFTRLHPKVFRFMVPWDAARLEQHVVRAESIIKAVRDRGVQEVLVTFNQPNSADVLFCNPDNPACTQPHNPAQAQSCWGYAPCSTVYEVEVAKFVKSFKNKVDVWGPANEPNMGWLDYDENGPKKAAEYFASLKEVVQVYAPSARITSPDFADASGFKKYIQKYKDEGGLWGNWVAWHPYTDVAERNTDNTQTLVGMIPSNREIWATEAGSRPCYVGSSGPGCENALTQLEYDYAQGNQVWWMLGPLAQHPRVKRISYYNLHDDGNASWDSALLRQDYSPRPSWYLWCFAMHGNNTSHPDCTGYPPPAPPPAPPTPPSDPPPPPAPSVEPDVDGDGQVDLVTIGSDGVGHTYSSTEESLFETDVESFEGGEEGTGSMDTALLDGIGQYVVDVADVDNDGKSDLITVEDEGKVLVHPGQGDRTFGSAADTGISLPPAMNGSGPNEPVAVADVTGDGFADLVVAVGPGAGSVSVYKGQLDGKFETTAVQSLSGMINSALPDSLGVYLLDVVDVDGDEMADLVGMHTNGTTYVCKGQSDGKFATPIAAASIDPIMDNEAGQEPVGLGDVNADGRADLLTLDGQTLKLWAGSANGTFAAATTPYASTVDSSLLDGVGQELVGLLDYDADGRSDLVSVDAGGDILSYQATSEGKFSAPDTEQASLVSTRQFEDGFEFASERPFPRRKGCAGEGGCLSPSPVAGPTLTYAPDGSLYAAMVGAGQSLSAITRLPTWAWQSPSSVAGSVTTRSRPASLLDETGILHLFARGPNNTLQHTMRYADGSWHGPYQVAGPGTTYSAPAVTIDSSSNISVLAQGPNHTLQETQRYGDLSWHGPYEIAGPGTVYSAPAVIRDNSSNIFVLSRGSNNTLQLVQRYGDWSWHGPYQVAGGNTTYSAPAVTIDSSSNISVLAQGPNNTLQETQRYGDWSWHGPYEVGGPGAAYSAPAVTRDNSNNIFVLAQGANNTLQETQRYGDWSWHGPYEVGGSGTTYSAPAVAMDPSGNIFVLAQGVANTLQLHQRYGDWSWHGPYQVGGVGSTY